MTTKNQQSTHKATNRADIDAPQAEMTNTQNTHKLKIWRTISLVSYAATFLLTFNWLSWYSPPEDVPRALLLLILVVPLVLPVKGFIHGRAMSYVAVAFVSMWLFAAGLDVAIYEQNWTELGWALVACSVLLFVACYFYLRYLPRPVKHEEDT